MEDEGVEGLAEVEFHGSELFGGGQCGGGGGCAGGDV